MFGMPGMPGNFQPPGMGHAPGQGMAQIPGQGFNQQYGNPPFGIPGGPHNMQAQPAFAAFNTSSASQSSTTPSMISTPSGPNLGSSSGLSVSGLNPAAVLATSANLDPNVKMIYNDESKSMEEKRAEMPKYHVKRDDQASVSRMNDLIERRISAQSS